MRRRIPELQLGERQKRRAKMINGMGKKRGKHAMVVYGHVRSSMNGHPGGVYMSCAMSLLVPWAFMALPWQHQGKRP